MNWKTQIEHALQINLIADQGLSDPKEAKARADELISALQQRASNRSELERLIDPQWVVLAAGKGIRIDPSGKINKNLDIYLGENNVIQLSRRNLIGRRSHLIIINPDMAKRILKKGEPTDNFELKPKVIDSRLIDFEAQNRLFGENSTLAVQKAADGTGGALKVAAEFLKSCEAEFVGVTFGDEPFLDKSIFVQTFIDHLIRNSDITLCGKIPKSVEGRGGLFFDFEGKFIGTKEWADMSPSEKQLMREKLSKGEAYTNTGITFIRRNLALERLSRLEKHSNGEYHHVDLIKAFYEDSLITNAYIYLGEVPPGINRWENVAEGFIKVAKSAQSLKLNSISQIVPPNYRPGIFKFGEKRSLPDWERLRTHVVNHCEKELIPRMTRNPDSQKIALQSVVELLNLKSGGSYASDELTPEELWGVVYQLLKTFAQNSDPYNREKRESEAVALKLLEKFEKSGAKHTSPFDWEEKVKLSIAANLIDYTSRAILEKIGREPNYFQRALEASLQCDLAIDDLQQFKRMLIDSPSNRIVWLADNSGEIVFDLWLIEHLVRLGNSVAIAAKPHPVSNDVTVDEVKNLLNRGIFKELSEVEVISSGSTTVGTDLYQATPEFIRSTLNADLVISKGQGNWYTTQGLMKDSFYMLMSKGMTSELSTGVAADKGKLTDGMILAFVPGGSKVEKNLKDFVERRKAAT